MNFYVLFYNVVHNYVEKRQAFREEHLMLAKDFAEQGHLVMAGAFTAPPDSAMLVFRVPDTSVIENFVNKDPYVKNGLVTDWKIRQWNVVIGN